MRAVGQIAHRYGKLRRTFARRPSSSACLLLAIPLSPPSSVVRRRRRGIAREVRHEIFRAGEDEDVVARSAETGRCSIRRHADWLVQPTPCSLKARENGIGPGVLRMPSVAAFGAFLNRAVVLVIGHLPS